MKKVLLAFMTLCLTSLPDYHLQVGDSILNPQIKLYGEVNHALVFGYTDSEGFGFVSTRIFDFRISYDAILDNLYIFGPDEPGCLVWVKIDGKWGVMDMDDYHMATPFCYEKISRFREVSVDYETGRGVYEAEALKDGVIDTIRIEKYLCAFYYDY
jgi:hypothetical protein